MDSNQIQEEKGLQNPEKVPKGKHSFEFEGRTFVVDEKYEPKSFIGYCVDGPKCLVTDKTSERKRIITKAENIFENQVYARELVREISILRFLDHENILQIVDIVQPDTKTGYKDIYLVTGHTNTDLGTVIRSAQQLSNEYFQYFLYQILRGILYIHSAGLIHRALRPSVILLNSDSDLKISDFKHSKPPPKEILFDTEYISNRYYRAPEDLLGELETQAVDIWASGCIFAELLGRRVLFGGKDYLDQLNQIIQVLGTPDEEEDLSFMKNQKAFEYIQRLPQTNKRSWESVFPNADPLALDLLDKMLTFNPEKRYTIQECLAHPYFEELHCTDEEPLCKEKFSWPENEKELSIEVLQSLIYDESEKIRSKK